MLSKTHVEFERLTDVWQVIRGNRQLDRGDGKTNSTKRRN